MMMKPVSRKTLLLCAGLAALVVVILLIKRDGIPGGDSLIPLVLNEKRAHWMWENPQTSRKALIPAEWEQAEKTVYADALLTLAHRSGKSLVYISHTQNSGARSLYEYVEDVTDLMRDQLGIGQFEEVDNKYRFYEAKGAELFRDIVARTRVRIWRAGKDDFWESVTITDQDYKNLEYDALNITEILIGTTQ